VIKKHRYSGFFATDLDLILREWGIDTVVISGTTTENCCHATARDAMFYNYKVAFLSDATGTFDYPDVGQGALSADDGGSILSMVYGISASGAFGSNRSIRASLARRGNAPVETFWIVESCGRVPWFTGQSMLAEYALPGQYAHSSKSSTRPSSAKCSTHRSRYS
jgi:hypothetical protein